ncbi:MAG: DUF4139 domain-containing protein [Sulfurimicrobium sp.]|nr:DUF4139 domain-containing protein [Sulfurimicrobium sp.]MDP2197932.1 DUF4139 domain-containing protein [Sulfurimicrobium sp.]
MAFNAQVWGLLAFFVAAQAQSASSPEKLSTLQDQQQVAVTIYNENLALIKDQRRVTPAKGANRLAWRDVSARIMPETAFLRSLAGGEGIVLLEQNFDFDLLTPQKLLDKYVGQSVTVIRTNAATGVESSETATVLSTNGGVVLKFADRIETGLPGRLAFKTVPDNLRDRPTLVISFLAPSEGERPMELSYLTGGLSWRADYVAELSSADDRLDLSGWVTLTNVSGSSYPNAKLQLVAGDVNRVRRELDFVQEGRVMKAAPMAAPAMAEEGLFEYHLYSLERLTTIAEQQTKQVALLSASHVPVHKELQLLGRDYYYRSSYGDLGQKMKVGVFMEFENKGGGLGVPLPKGVIRVYKKDAAGKAQFVGEDRIDHTPRGEMVRLKLGEAFDVTADKKQTSFLKLSGSGRDSTVFESAYQIELKNAKDEAVIVNVIEPVPGDWEMLAESLPHRKPASNTAAWRMQVPARGKAILDYRVRVKL